MTETVRSPEHKRGRRNSPLSQDATMAPAAETTAPAGDLAKAALQADNEEAAPFRLSPTLSSLRVS